MSDEPRSMCWRCRKPQALCLCGRIAVVHNRTGIVVLQHRKERNHPLGTARLIRLGLDNQRQHVLLSQDGPSEAVALPPGAALLYPSEGARDLGELAPHERPTDLVLLDATWPLAHQLYRDNPWIRELPHVRLSPTAPSRYRIRTEPRHECLSTLEAAVQALEVLEPELEGLDALLLAFDALIDGQLQAGDGRGRARPRKVRRRPPRVIPAALRIPDSRVVVAYIEAGPREGTPVPAPLHWTAVRWRDGAVFDRLSPQGRSLPADFVAGLGLVGVSLGDDSVAEVGRDFAAFCGPEARVWCWGRAGQEHAAGAVGEGATLRLKPVWTNLRRTRYVSHLADITAELGLAVPRLPVRGRAGQRLARTDAMARYLRGLRTAASSPAIPSSRSRT